LTRRLATPADAAALAAFINEAFLVEAFFKIGDRTDEADVLEHMREGDFLVVESPNGLIGCVYVAISRDRAYLGMLSVDRSSQRQAMAGSSLNGPSRMRWLEGVGSWTCTSSICAQSSFPYYQALGYRESGTLPFEDSGRISLPCHFVVMTKSCQASRPGLHHAIQSA
jgi:predicted N-acetyltransferase YhbS